MPVSHKRALVALLAATVAHADPWPGPGTAQVVVSDGGVLTTLDPLLQLEMSGAHWNEETKTLWVTAGGSSGAGTWALALDEATQHFSVLELWPTPRDESITQVTLAPVSPGVHRVFVLRETAAQIVEARMTVQAMGNGTSVIDHTWTITEAAPNGNSGAEGLCFVPDEWLVRSGFVDGAGAAWTQSQGGLGGLMFLAHQNGGHLYAVDLSADGSNRFAGKSYRVVGIYATGFSESSGLEIDRSIGRLYISHNIGGNRLEVSSLRSTPGGSGAATRTLDSLVVYDLPVLSNPEGFAIRPFLDGTGARRARQDAFLTNDAEASEIAANKKNAVLWFRGLDLSAVEATLPDAGTPPLDAGTPPPDAGSPTPDAGEEPPDAGQQHDAGEVTPTDAGAAADAGTNPMTAPQGCGCHAAAPSLLALLLLLSATTTARRNGSRRSLPSPAASRAAPAHGRRQGCRSSRAPWC